jgi:DNA polymerase I-like protein with 3'-5' exonuclease and polymerase domains
MFIDLETQNKPYYGAVASPRNPENFVVAVGSATDMNPYDGEIVGTYYESRAEHWLTIPDDVWLLVAHNAPFEMDWFLTQQNAEITKFLARGGRVFCTAYAEYLLTNQQETYPSLDTTAPKYGGTHKVDGVKILWEQGVLTADIDRALLMEYLIGPEGDIENTRKTFYGQYAALVQRGMWDMALVRMEGLLYNCYAMYSGLHVDKKVAFDELELINTDLDSITQHFMKFRQHIPEYVQFKDSSDFHMSAWLFGGPIKYKIRDVWYEDDGVTPKQENVKCWKFGEQMCIIPEDGFTAEQFQERVQQYGAVERSKAGKNKGQPREFSVKSGQPKLRWYDRVFQCEPLLNLDLMPAEIKKEFKNEFAGKRKLADESPVYSTGADAIEMLSKRKEFPEEQRELLTLLLKYAKLDKDAGTYYLREVRDEEGNVLKQSGMLQYLTPQSIVYHTLNATSTVTTRLSGTKPNMQNIPRGDTSNVKNMFTSRFDSVSWLMWALYNQVISQELHDECQANIAAGIRNGAIIEADYSALEVVTLAAFSKDRALIKALLEGIDMHCMRLSKKLNEPYESVLLKCKDEDHPEHAAYKTMRTDIKPPSFAYQYGATAHGIAFSTGCTVEYAEEFIANEKALFPEVESFYEDQVFTEIEANTTMHREQTDNGGWRVYKRGVWRSPAGTCYEFRQYPKTVWKDGQKLDLMQFKPTQMRNYPIQGESGFFVQGIAGLVVRWLISVGFFGGKVCIINQVHDALYLDVHVSVLHDVAVTLKIIMESVPTYFKTLGYDLCVPFPVEVEAGPNMNNKVKVA